MPSATIAERSDSIAPSAAMVKAGPIKSRIDSSEIGGKCKPGNPAGMPPNWLSMVATGQPAKYATAVVMTTATMLAGTRLVRKGQP